MRTLKAVRRSMPVTWWTHARNRVVTIIQGWPTLSTLSPDSLQTPGSSERGERPAWANNGVNFIERRMRVQCREWGVSKVKMSLKSVRRWCQGHYYYHSPRQNCPLISPLASQGWSEGLLGLTGGGSEVLSVLSVTGSSLSILFPWFSGLLSLSPWPSLRLWSIFSTTCWSSDCILCSSISLSVSHSSSNDPPSDNDLMLSLLDSSSSIKLLM